MNNAISTVVERFYIASSQPGSPNRVVSIDLLDPNERQEAMNQGQQAIQNAKIGMTQGGVGGIDIPIVKNNRLIAMGRLIQF